MLKHKIEKDQEMENIRKKYFTKINWLNWRVQPPKNVKMRISKVENFNVMI